MGQEDVNLEIRKQKFGWIGHTIRKYHGEIPKATLQWNPQGSRKRGRPKKIVGEDRLSKKLGGRLNELRLLTPARQKG
jgi:hypothetical protein